MRSACFLSGPALINRLQDDIRSRGITSQVSPPGLCSWPTMLPCSYYDPLAPTVPLFPQIRYTFSGRQRPAIAKGSPACFPLLPQWQNFLAGHQVIHIMTTHPSFLCRQRGPDTKFWLKLHKKCLSAWQIPETFSKRPCRLFFVPSPILWPETWAVWHYEDDEHALGGQHDNVGGTCVPEDCMEQSLTSSGLNA